VISYLHQSTFTKAIDDIRARCAALDAEELANLDREMAVSFEEHFAYQNAQSRAHVSGKLSTDDAQIIYASLGEVGDPDNGGWATDADTGVKVAVTLAMNTLLRR